jgi:rhamnose utilization protein RhaD (predicted bifunctional aldolase and dehydrogenase)/NAD(P)-dependent dehydrogenase (short-subunit alcohol dehydrogenase family)
MKNRWDAGEAAAFTGPVSECVYCTRLIGADPSLVLHGGGNSSVKAPYRDVTGRDLDALYVKGSGWDMASIEVAGLTPLRLARVQELVALDALSDTDMMRELDAARLDPGAPSPSVESLLHAFLPHPAVQHSHADIIVTLTNLADGDDVVREVYGDDVVVVPYVMPGFDLAVRVRETWGEQATDRTTGMVLLNHGLFTFGADSGEAYRRHVELIDRAERWLDGRAPGALDDGPPLPEVAIDELADVRRAISDAAGAPMVVRRHTDGPVRRFVARPDLASLASRGPLTPDHVIRTKRVPMIGRDVDGFVTAYREYVDANRHRARTGLTELDPAPRIVLDRELGMLAIGRTAKDSRIAADIYHHTIPVLERAEDHLGGYRALPADDLFDMEYWALEQAKLQRAGAPAELTGQVAIVTGAASGIGRACAEALLARGACVTGIDLSDRVESTFTGEAWLGCTADVTDPAAQSAALAACVERFGGVDVAVIGAGIFPASTAVASFEPGEWRSVMAVNLDAAADLLAALHPLLVRSPVDARVVVIGSKNVPAPGRGAAAYSASKAALTQLSRVAALEWAGDGIRVNVVHPDAVFDTGLWTEALVAERAARYGLTVDEYKRRNLLGAEITAKDVAALVAALCGSAFRVTTGAQIPIDGGNERVV